MKEIVNTVGQFTYPSKSVAIARNNKTNKLMKINDNEGVVILERRPAEADDKVSHAEACELETRVGSKVEIYDPQRGEFSFSGDKEDFRNYVKDDRVLLLYIVE